MTLFPFTPAIGQNMTFNPVLNGVTYSAIVTWNVFGQRWYLNLYDSSGNLIIATAVVSSDDPYSIEAISWINNVVTVTTSYPHFLKLGTVVNLALTGNSPDAYNGLFQCLVTGPSTFTYAMDSNPGQSVTVGYFGGIVDLCAGQFSPSTLVFYNNSSQFATLP